MSGPNDTSEKVRKICKEGVNGVKARHASGGRDGLTRADIDDNAWDNRGRTMAVGGFVANRSDSTSPLRNTTSIVEF